MRVSELLVLYCRDDRSPTIASVGDNGRHAAAGFRIVVTDTLLGAIGFAEAHAVALTAISVAMLVATLIVFPFVLVRLPRRYFAEESRPEPLSRHLLIHWLLMSLKNLLGLVLVLVGILLMFLPGQGLLTLVIGLTIMNYPGKFAVERWLARRPRVLPALNWIRLRFDAPPFDDP